MSRICLGALVAFLAIATLQAKPKHCMLRIHTEASPNDTIIFSTAVKAQFSGKQIAIEKIPRISEQDVEAFLPFPAGKNNFGVLFQLDEHGKMALDALSVERRGGVLFVFINGRPITEFQIDKRVADGQIYIASGLTSADIELMKKDWRIIGERKRR
jgi:hypothetical protein